MKRFISFSGGVESSTMCVLWGNKADAIFSDTGFEHQEVYDRIDLVERYIKENIRESFKIIKIKNKKYSSLKTYIMEKKFYPNFKARYCTRLFKIEPVDDYLEQFQDQSIGLMIGLNADEIEQRTGNHGNKSFVKYSYPLAGNGLNREDCKVILNKINLLPQFPVYMQRGGCIGCYYKSKNEYIAMAILNPQEFDIVEKLENDIQDKRKKKFTILRNISMKELRENATNTLFDTKELYPVVNDVTQCGVFCNR